MPRWKRALDILVILLAAPGWLPVGLLIALAIRLSSPGPIFFRQQRIGLGGQSFDCLKFRSMRVNAATDVHHQHVGNLIQSNAPLTKLDARGDRRLIPCGLILRTLGLDELPQIINVLRGEMSIVGPRPCLPFEYENGLNQYPRRFHTLPGLTGLWQTSGKNRTTFQQMIALDVAYAARKSLGLDLKIMLLTPVAIITQVFDTFRSRRATTARPELHAAQP